MTPLTDGEQTFYDAASVCGECGDKFTTTNHKVRHHDHVSGHYPDGGTEGLRDGQNYDSQDRASIAASRGKKTDGSWVIHDPCDPSDFRDPFDP